MEETKKDKKKFEKIVALVQGAERVPSNIKAEVEKIKKQIEGAKVCSTIHRSHDCVDYKAALKALKEVLSKHYQELPKSIQREIK